MRGEKIILHLDMDAFFASCAQAHDKTLKNKPVVVARKNEKSIIIAASYESRKYGIKSGMPVYKAKELSKNDLFIANIDRDIYVNYSNMVFDLIKKYFTHKIEILGIDECYIDVTDIWKQYGSIKNICVAIQSKVYQETSLTCSIGASFNKTFAKMGSDMKKPNGVTIINRDNFKVLIWDQPIENVIGIGISSMKKIESLNIKTIIDFIKISDDVIIEKFGLPGYKIKNNLQGINNNVIDWKSNDIKSISKDKTFEKPMTNYEELDEILFNLTVLAVNRMKENQYKCKTVQLSLKYEKNGIKSAYDKKASRKSFSTTLEEYTNDLEIIYSLAKNNLEENYNDRNVILIGISLSNLKKEENIIIQKKLGNGIFN